MAKPVTALLASYPRVRPPLSPEHRALYVEHHRANRLGASPLQAMALRLESWMHRQVSAGWPSRTDSILEIGAGTLNHVAYEPACRHYDVVEPFEALYADSPQRSRVAAIYADIRDVPPQNRYGRVLSVAVLEHLTDLPAVVARGGLLMAPGGMFQAAIPSEGGFLWGATWRCTTGVVFRLRTGLDYASLMRHEHVNDAGEILETLHHFFSFVRVRRFPLSLHHLSLYTYVEATEPRTEACAAFVHAVEAERR